MLNDDVYKALKKYFGYDSFRLSQEDVISRTLRNESSLVIMATGGGKSIIYQLPAIILEGLTIVVSPLIALMQDQVNALKANGIDGCSLNSNCSSDEESDIKMRVEAGNVKILYVSPERAVTPSFLGWIRSIKVSQIAIDEAHCVSVWGNDFRPEYTRLVELTRLFPNAAVVALTATADASTQQDIIAQLNLEDAKSFVSSFERKNININVLPAKDRIKVINKFLSDRKNEPGIVYCLSRKSTEEVARKLRSFGYSAKHYHAGLGAEERETIQDAFQRDEIDIICATIAFGMGIDKPNIRWVIHYNLPKNIEGYYQEIGRAGRDGKQSDALLFAGYGDMKTLKEFTQDGVGSLEFKDVQAAKLERMWEFTQTLSCRTNFVLNYFGEYKEEACGHCDRCLNPPMCFDGTVIAQKALSACYWLQQDVNMKMLVDVLRGSNRFDLVSKGYNKIKTFGAGSDIEWKDWMSYITQMIDQGLMGIDFTRNSRLYLTNRSMEILKEGKKVFLSEPQEFKSTKPSVVEKKGGDLFDELVKLRLAISKRDNTQAYIVFNNASLEDMAQKKPVSLDEFMDVKGVSYKKCEKYGNDFVGLISKFIERTSSARA